MADLLNNSNQPVSLENDPLQAVSARSQIGGIIQPTTTTVSPSSQYVPSDELEGLPTIASTPLKQQNRLFKGQALMIVLTLAVSILGLVLFFFNHSSVNQLADSKTKNIPAQGVNLNGEAIGIGPIQLQTNTSAVIINGDLFTKGTLRLYNGSHYLELAAPTLNSDIVYNLPDTSGTVCLDSNNCNYATAAQLNQVAQKAGINGKDGAQGPKGDTGAQGPQGASGAGSCPLGPCVSLQATTPGSAETGNINITGTMIAGFFVGDGSSVSNVNAVSLNGNNSSFYTNASNISSGTLSDTRLSLNVTLQGNTFNGASQLVQLNASTQLPAISGVLLTNLNASNVSSGTLNDARLSSNVALLNGTGPQTFSGNNKFTGTFLAQNAADSATAFQIQNAAGTSNLLIANTTTSRVGIGKAPTLGVLDVNGAIYQSGNQVCDTSGNCVGGGGAGAIGGGGTAGTISLFTGSGFTIGDSILTQSGGAVTAAGNINVTGQYQVGGSQISSANLSNDANLAKLNGTQIFSGDNTFSSASNSFTGSGAGLTSLNATNVSSGTLSDSRLSGNVALLNGTGPQTFSGNNKFTGTLLSQNASNSTAAFQVQNALGNEIFTIDTSGAQAVLGKASTLDGKLLFRSASGTGSIVILPANPGVSNFTITLPAENGTVCLQNSANCGFAASSGSGNYVQLQASTPGTAQTGNFNITGSGLAGALYQSGNQVCDTSGNCVGGGGAGAIGGGGTAGTIPIFTGSGFTIGDSNLTKSGSTVTNTGTFNATVALQTNSTTRIDSSGNLSNIGNLTTTGASTFSTTGSNGFTFKAGTDNATTFQVQNASSSKSVFAVDTSGNQVVLGNSGASGITGQIKFNFTGQTGSITLASNNPASSNFTLNLPAENGTLCSTGSVCAGYAAGSGSGNYIQNQSAADQSADFRITGTGRANTSLLSPALDVASAGTLSVGTTTATAVNIGNGSGSTSVAVSCGSGTCGFGNNAVDHSTTLGSVTGTSLTTLNGGTGGINIGTGNVANTIQIGNTANAIAQTIRIGNNATGSSTDAITIGNLLGTSSTVIQGGTGASAIQLTQGSGGTITIGATGGSSAVSVQCGTGTCGFGNNATDHSTTLGSTTGTSLTTINGGTGGIKATSNIIANAAATGTTGTTSGTGGSNVTSITLASAGSFANNDIIFVDNTGGDGQDYYTRITAGGGSTNLTVSPAVSYGTAAGYTGNATITKYTAQNIGATSSDYTTQTNRFFQGYFLGGIVTGAGSTSYSDANIKSATNLRVNTASGVNIQGTNSATAFQVQNSSGGHLVQVDTTNNQITLGGLNSGEVNAWQTNANALPANVDFHASVTANGYVYAIGGYAGGGVHYDTVYYAKLNADGSTGVWQTNTNSLPATRGGLSSVVANGYVYAIGGDNGAGIHDTVYYAKLNADGSTGVWQTNANALPDIRVNHTSVVANGYVYVLGGQNGGGGLDTVYYAKLNTDGSTGVWQTNTNSLPGGTNTHSSVVANGYVYVLGGGISTTVYYAKLNTDGSTGVWSTNANSLPAIRTYNSSVVANGYVYVLGGGDISNTVYYAKLNSDGSTGTWSTNTNTLPAARGFHTSVINNGYVYVLGGGGSSAEDPQSTVYYASTQKIIESGSTYSDNLIVQKGLNVQADTLLQGTTNSTTAFQIQNQTGGNLFQVDTANNQITIGGLNSGEVNAWATNLTSFPTNISAHGEVVVNGYIYVIGGSDGSVTNSVRYAKVNSDGSVGNWTSTSSLPAAVNDMGATAANGYIYSVGGFDNTGLSTVNTYYARINADGSLDAWQTGSSFGGNGIASNRAVTANGYIYSLGGISGYSNWALGDTNVYYAKLKADGSLGPWQTNTNFPSTYANAQVVVSNGYMYVAGFTNNYRNYGGDNRVYYAKINSNGILDSWQSGNSLPISIAAGSAVVLNGYIYIVAGATGSGYIGSYNQVYYAELNADGSIGSWQNAANYPINSQDHRAVAYNGDIYSIGGDGGSTVYYASTQKIIESGSTYSDNLIVQKGLNVQADTLLQGTTNSTTAFQIQNQTGGNLFQVDTANNQITIGGLNSGEVNAWTLNSQSLPTTLFNHTSVTANGYVYVIGGNNGGGQVDTVYYAKLNNDGSTDVWQTANNLPSALEQLAAVTTNGYIYVTGGANGGGQVDTVYYAKLNTDGTIGAWVTSTNVLPAARNGHASVAANGYIYVIGGDDGTSGGVATVYYAKVNADGSTGVWQTNVNNMPAGLRWLSSVVANGYVYTLGGDLCCGTNQVDSVYYAKLNADGSTGVWQTNANVLPNALRLESSVAANGYIYTFGGAITDTVYYAKVNPDGSTGAWQTSANGLPGNSEAHTSIIYNGYVYVIGGWFGSTVYYASTQKIIESGSTYSDNLIVQKGLNVQADTLLQGTTNSTTAFQIQNQTGGNLFQVDTANNQITIGGLNSGEVNAWTTSANSLPDSLETVATASANGYIYSIGGWDGATSKDAVYYAKVNADGSTSAWQTNTYSLPGTRNRAAAVIVNGYIYVIAGWENFYPDTPQTTVYYARLNSDGSTGAWQTSANSLPNGVAGHSAVSANGYIYVDGGYGCGGGDCSDVYYAKANADGSTGAWQTGSSLPKSVNVGESVVANGYMYVVGGIQNGFNGGEVYYASLNSDGSLSSWTTDANNLPANSYSLSSVVSNGYIYAISGINAGSDVYYAKLNSDGSTGTWQTSVHSLPQALAGHKSVIVNGYVYTIGGNNGSSVDTVYYASTQRVLVGGSLDLVGLGGSKLADAGGTGGSLTAANGTFVGSLQVQGPASFADALSINKELTVSGTVVLQNSSDSELSFQVLDSIGNQVIWTDTTNDSLHAPTLYTSQILGFGAIAVDGGSSVVFQNTNNSPDAFKIQNATGDELFKVDTLNNQITIGGLNSGELNEWTTNAESLPAARVGHTSVTANGYAYVIGGNGPVSTVYYAKLNADGSTGTWSTNANSLPSARTQHSSVVANGYVYVIGGDNGGFKNTVYYAKLNADGSTGAWQTNSNALPTVQGGQSSVVANGYIYTFGGAGSPQNAVYYAKLNADGSTGTWSTNANALPANRWYGSAVVANGYAYMIGGEDGSNTQASVYYAKLNADGSTGTWSTNANALPDSAEFHSSVVANGYVYVMGGYDNTLADQDTIFYAKLNSDGSTGTWSTNANALPAADHSQTSIIANGYVYLIGGNNAGDAVYYASTQRILVGGSLDLIGLGGQGLGDTSGAGTGGSLTAANGSFTGSLQVQGAVSLADALSVDKELRVGGSALFQNQADSTTAFQVQSSAGTNLLAVDTSGSVVYIGVTGSTNVNSTIHIGDSTSGIQTITIGSTNSSSAVTIQAGSGDITLKGHVQSTQTTKPTIGTPSNCGTGSPSAAVTNSSTDSAGSFTITAGTGSPTTCDTIITFNATYGTAPKSIILTATKAVGSATAVLSAQVNASAAGTFTVQIAPTNAAASGVYSFYYWVIK